MIYAEIDYMQRARASCGKARFDYTGIEARLRSSAAAGDAASATELAQFLRDPAKREEMLQTAVKKNYPPAVYKIATNLLMAVQRGQTTENVERDPRAAQDRGPRRFRARNWISRTAWRSAATAIPPTR